MTRRCDSSACDKNAELQVSMASVARPMATDTMSKDLCLFHSRLWVDYALEHGITEIKIFKSVYANVS